MLEPKTNCRKCDVKILQTTADRTGGLCVPCHEGRKIRQKCQNIEREPGRHVDWMCIDIIKDTETNEYADYFFSSTITDKDPRYKNRGMVVGHTVGLLRITKTSGEVQLLYPMTEDSEGKRFIRAASVVTKHWRSNEYPERTMFACG